MSVEDLGNIGEFIASIAVLISLVYLALQLRHNTAQLHENEKALERAEHNALMQNWSNLRGHVMTDESLARLIVRARTEYGALDEVDKERLVAYYTEILWINYHLWKRVQDSIFEEDQWARILPFIQTIVREPAGAIAWRQGRHIFEPGFTEVVETEGDA